MRVNTTLWWATTAALQLWSSFNKYFRLTIDHRLYTVQFGSETQLLVNATVVLCPLHVEIAKYLLTSFLHWFKCCNVVFTAPKWLKISSSVFFYFFSLSLSFCFGFSTTVRTPGPLGHKWDIHAPLKYCYGSAFLNETISWRLSSFGSSETSPPFTTSHCFDFMQTFLIS